MGTVSASASQFKFTDSGIDFNLKQILRYDKVQGQSTPVYKYLIPGLTAKVNFTSGQLMGYTFDLEDYDHATKTFTIKPYTNESGLEFPSKETASPFKIGVGDTYVLIDIRLPDEYVEAAETKLLAAGQAYLDENNSPNVEYSLELDEFYLQQQATDTRPIPLDIPPIFFEVGDTVRVTDADLGIDTQVRILSFTRDVLRPYKYTLTLGKARRVSLVEKILRTQAKVTRTLDNGGLTDTTPAVVPPGEATSKDDLVNLIKKSMGAFGNLFHLTASSGLPAGYVELKAGSPVRHQLQADVVQKTGQLSTILGRVKAIGVRRLPDLL